MQYNHFLEIWEIMIPIFWRYATTCYLRILCLCVGTFVSILLVSRFKEIARFAALSCNGSKTILYTLYQIPFILPMAIPLSALIASYLLFQRLSRSYELTALRASGLSFKNILTPLLITSGFVALLNFSISTEVSPFCRRETKSIFYRETTANPLLLFQRHGLIKLKNAYLQMNVEKEGRVVKDFILITRNESNNRLGLLTASKLKTKAEYLAGENVAIVSHLHSEEQNQFDPLIIENQAQMTTTASLLSTALKKNRPKIDVRSLDFRMLRLRVKDGGGAGKSAFSEILRRLSVGLAVFSFTLLGCAYGTELGRISSRRPMMYALFLTVLLLASYFLGKSLCFNPLIALFCMFIPHLLIWIFSIHRLRRISQGAHS